MKAVTARMRTVVTMAVLATGVSLASFAAEDVEQLCEGFLPENNLNIPVAGTPIRVFGLLDGPTVPAPSTGVSEADYNDLLEKMEAKFTPIVAKAGGVLKIDKQWANGTVNAFAYRSGSEYHLSLPGGLPRVPAMTADAYTGVVCHELGHHIGGAPLISADGGMSNEGAADYYATLKCLRILFDGQDNAKAIEGKEIDPVAVKMCDQQFAEESDRLICKRSSLVTLALGKVLKSINKEIADAKLDTPDPLVVTSTSNSHPATQCRVDTMFSGSICQVKADVSLSNTDVREGACMEGTHELGARPKCWFLNPSEAAPAPVLTITSN